MNIFYKKLGRRGFTLIELIVVIAVLAIIVTMAVPNFLQQTRDARFVKACSDAKVISDVVLQKIAMAGGVAPIDESTSYAAEEVAGAIGDSLYDFTGRSVAGVPVGTYYPIDETEIQDLISEDVDLSHMVMDQDGNLYFAAAAPGGAGEEAGGHVPFPDTITPAEIAKAAGNLLAYNTIKQVNDSVGGTTGDAHAVYEAVKENITPKITAWYNGLSAEDQQAYAGKVRGDEDLMVLELIPQDIVTDIIFESVGYSGEFYNYVPDKYNYIFDKLIGGMQYHQTYDLTYQQQYEMRKATNTVYQYFGIGHYKLDTEDTWDVAFYFKDYIYSSPAKIYRIADLDDLSWIDFCINNNISNPLDYVDAATPIIVDESYTTDDAMFGMDRLTSLIGQYSILTVSNYSTYSPDDQQETPFYYPVNNLKMTYVWDPETVVDADLQNDELIYAAIEALEYDVSCGASVAIPLDYVSDQLVNFNTGLPLDLGSDTPWAIANGQ